MTNIADASLSTEPTVNLAQSSVQLPRYRRVETIYQGSRTVVYRAVEEATQKTVVIKALREAYPSFGELVQFRNQYTITQNLSIPGIVQPLSLEPLGNGYALIMEDEGGISLADYAVADNTVADNTQPPPLPEVLGIALQLADILHDLHQQRVIHKDIKPANILIHPDSKRVKLIDFSIASLLPKETQAIQNPKSLEGTLAYMAPEQTGRMNRAVDYRSDFYGLGVTLYELLTGQLPFTSDDPLALIHCHMAQLPVAAEQVNPQVPGMVAAIVAKLMAKNAEDRYQSALGLKHDLEQCLIQWKEQGQKTGEIAAFELGQRDVYDRFLIPEKLYGRESEVDTLLNAFTRVSRGASELMLVEGVSGIGKTAVVNEVHKPITQKKGYFIKGKFDQFKQNIPLSAFVQALRDLVRQILSENDVELARWKAKILEALGANAQVIIDLIPELALILGPQPTANPLSGSAAQNRFNALFLKFIRIFAAPDHPLVIFIDDLQWVDLASLHLIQLLMGEAQIGHLLLLGAYRDNEVSAAHPLMLTIAHLRESGVAVSSITLKPLNTKSLNLLVADTLHVQQSVAQPLTDLIRQKTQGNPFFSVQFLKMLHQERLIAFDYGSWCWQCDISHVREVALTDDVVQCVTLQIQQLSDATQHALQQAACIGAQFDLDTLAVVMGMAQSEAAIALWNALQEGIVLPESDLYKFYLDQDTNSQSPLTDSLHYRFLHDRVQQAAYELIPSEHRQQVHLQIGQRLLHHIPQAEQAERIFDIVGQLNISHSLLTGKGDREQLARLNLLAGQRAKQSTAYQAAIEYSTLGIQLLDTAFCWQSQYDLTLALHEVATEACYLSGAFTAMDTWAEAILNNTQTPLEQVKAYEVKIQACIAQNQLLQGIEVAFQILDKLGVQLPDQPTPEDFTTYLQAVQTKIGDRIPADLLQLSVMQDGQHLAILRILSSMFGLAYNAHP
ncbi:MAG: serine/threonine-protein kinase PknK, partial [Cyanobacteria bacterium P01_D01_bin.105]